MKGHIAYDTIEKPSKDKILYGRDLMSTSYDREDKNAGSSLAPNSKMDHAGKDPHSIQIADKEALLLQTSVHSKQNMFEMPNDQDMDSNLAQ